MNLTKRRRPQRNNKQGLLTILFTDLEGSTAMTQRLGDARAQEIVRAHNTIVRREVSTRGGTEVKHTGDGIMATFPSAARAVAAAVAMQQATRTYNDGHPETAFNIAIGLNAGEPVAEDADVFGSAVQLAARTCAEAHGGQILATNVVRELVFGKGALFADAGSAELKGFSEAVHLFEVGVGAEGIDEGDWAARRSPARWMLAGAVIVAVGAAAGITLALMQSGGGSPTVASVPFTELRFQTKVTTTLGVVSGDCTANDLVLQGETKGPVSGAFTGQLEAHSDVTQPIAEKCQSVIVTSAGRIFAGADSITFADFLRARPRVGKFDTANPGAAPAALEGTDVWVITGGDGRYAGASGDGRCELAGLSIAGINATSDLNCVLNLTVSGASAPLALRADSGAREIAEGVSQAAPSETEIFMIYRNNTDAALIGLSLSLGSPAAAHLTAAPAGDKLAAVSADTTWPLPDLPPGAVARFRLHVRLVSGGGDSLTLSPQIGATGLKAAARSAPITIAVAR